MADTEVENTLREIRERVRAGEAQPQATPVRQEVETLTLSEDTPRPPVALADARARIEANLATVERAWNKLPPVMSYRRGWAARIELWLKRQIKRATHWFTWEQVNFNAAVHNALRDTVAALADYEQQLARMQAEQTAAITRQTETLSRLTAMAESALASASDVLSSARALTSTLASKLENETTELRSSITALAEEQRERIAYVAEEQRVCFKQLSLEATETEVAADRARRILEQRLDELAKAVTRLNR
ncbi:MAG TPA: hypothetical protein VGB73_03685 [Pyrinomonadaceae bacterium]|jgi:hypothetical protein